MLYIWLLTIDSWFAIKSTFDAMKHLISIKAILSFFIYIHFYSYYFQVCIYRIWRKPQNGNGISLNAKDEIPNMKYKLGETLRRVADNAIPGQWREKLIISHENWFWNNQKIVQFKKTKITREKKCTYFQGNEGEIYHITSRMILKQ